MKTKKYTIELTSTDKEHKKVKTLIDALFEELRFKVEGDIDFYVQPVETRPKRKNRLYLLGKEENLHFTR